MWRGEDSEGEKGQVRDIREECVTGRERVTRTDHICYLEAIATVLEQRYFPSLITETASQTAASSTPGHRGAGAGRRLKALE